MGWTKWPATYTRYFALGMQLSPAFQSLFSFHLKCIYARKNKTTTKQQQKQNKTKQNKTTTTTTNRKKKKKCTSQVERSRVTQVLHTQLHDLLLYSACMYIRASDEKIDNFKICYARTRYLSKIHKSQTIIPRAAKLRICTQFVLGLNVLGVKKWAKFGSSEF